MTPIGILFAVILSFLCGYIFTPFVRGIALRWKICEKPNGRTSRDIAHIGGVAIIAAILFTLIPVFLFLLPENPLHKAFLPVFIASGFLIFLLGIIDDLRSLHYFYKLFFQVAVSVFVSAGGLALLDHFGVMSLSLPAALVAFVGVALWMLSITTSFNLIDGIDGLATGTALISSAAFGVAAYIFEQPVVLALSLVTIGASAAFLRFNFPPARIFMGDSGSLFLGLIIGLISLLILFPGDGLFFRIAGSVIILSIPLLDTVCASLRRLLTNRPIFEADLRHIHHILLYRFQSVRKVDFMLWSLCAVFGLLGVMTMLGSVAAFVVSVVLQLSVFIFSLRSMVGFDLPRDKVEEILGHCGINASRVAPRGD